MMVNFLNWGWLNIMMYCFMKHSYLQAFVKHKYQCGTYISYNAMKLLYLHPISFWSFIYIKKRWDFKGLLLPVQSDMLNVHFISLSLSPPLPPLLFLYIVINLACVETQGFQSLSFWQIISHGRDSSSQSHKENRSRVSIPDPVMRRDSPVLSEGKADTDPIWAPTARAQLPQHNTVLGKN